MERANGYGGKDCEKESFRLRREWKTSRVHDQSVAMEKSWVMMNDKEHKE